MSLWHSKHASGSLAFNKFCPFPPMCIEWQLSQETSADLCLLISQNAKFFVSPWHARHFEAFSRVSTFFPKAKMASPLPPPFPACSAPGPWHDSHPSLL